MMRLLVTALVGFAVVVTSSARAQGTAADYARAETLGQRFANKVMHAKVDAHWTADDSGFWFRSDTGPGTWEFVRIDTATAKRQVAFDHGKLAAALSTAANVKFQADRLPLE